MGVGGKSKLVKIVVCEMFFMMLKEESYHRVVENKEYGGKLGRELSMIIKKEHATNGRYLNANVAKQLAFEKDELESFEHQIVDLTEQCGNDLVDRFEKETGLTNTWDIIRQYINELSENEEFIATVIYYINEID